MKKAIITAIIITVMLGMTACSSTRFTNEERFAARANLTINYNIRKYLPNSIDYGFTSLEFYQESDARVIRADCSIRVGQRADDTVRSVFLLSDKQWYIVDFLRGNPDFNIEPIWEDDTEMWYINLEDYEFTPDRNNFVDRINANTLMQRFLETEDKSLLGM